MCVEGQRSLRRIALTLFVDRMSPNTFRGHNEICHIEGASAMADLIPEGAIEMRFHDEGPSQRVFRTILCVDKSPVLVVPSVQT